MTRKQLMGFYHESFIIEAEEQLRLVLAIRYGHPQMDSKSYIEGLQGQANPPDPEEAAAVGLAGFKQLEAMFGREIKEVENIGGYIEMKKPPK